MEKKDEVPETHNGDDLVRVGHDGDGKKSGVELWSRNDLYKKLWNSLSIRDNTLVS